MSDGPLFERAQRGAPSEEDAPDVWSVAALNRSVRLRLESEWGGVWVHGEIADLTRAATGHVYFTLNDEREAAQLKAVMFRSDARRARAKLERGARVRIFGRLSLYEPRGNFQMIAQRALPAGEGELAAQLRRLIKKLEAEGLTDPARKRPLPLLPRTVGLVTSEHGAAVHDVMRVTRGRCPVRIVLAPCRVQGAEAPAEIVRALNALQRLPGLDVVIVARGGGASEDLWAFNDEGVARAVAACPVPVVSGVGHQTDVTLCDLVADVRAATPSNAAELVCPERAALVERMGGLERALYRALETHVGRKRVRLGELQRRLSDPRHALRGHAQALAQLEARLSRAMQAALRGPRQRVQQLQRRLAPHSPQARLRDWRASLTSQQARLLQSPQKWLVPRRDQLQAHALRVHQFGPAHLRELRHRLARLAGQLSALSPLSVLGRGYAIALDAQSGRAVCDANDVQEGDPLDIRLHRGRLQTRVEKKLPE